jgi:hypothetical protein
MQGSVHEKKRGARKMAIVAYQSGTLAIDVTLFFNFAVVFYSTYFRSAQYS